MSESEINTIRCPQCGDTMLAEGEGNGMPCESCADTHNGWSNYPTWNVNLWLSNDETLYNQTLEIVRNAIENAPIHRNTLYGIWTTQESARFSIADDLKRFVCDDLAPDLGASFAADLLGYALDEVNWSEIADAWIEDAMPDERITDESHD